MVGGGVKNVGGRNVKREKFYMSDKKKARITPHLKCFHNGIILIVICFRIANVEKVFK